MMEENTKGKIAKKHYWVVLIIIVLVLAVITGTKNNGQPQQEIPTYVDEGDSLEITESISEEITAMESDEETTEDLFAKIDDIFFKWDNGEENAADTIVALEEYLKMDNDELSAYAQEKIDYIVLETECQNQFAEGKTEFDAGNYVTALKILMGITDRYSKYGSVVGMVFQCKEAVLKATSAPYTVEEYETCLEMLNECLTVTSERELVNRKEKLEDEFTLLKEVLAVIQTATELYDGGLVEEAFFVLSSGLNDYPENERIEEALVNFHNHYLFSTVSQVSELCDQEKYDEAIALLETAVTEYECDEFSHLLDSVKKEKSFLYRISNNLVEKFKFFAQKWESEEITVQQMANDAGAYIVKSGQKFMLGNYSEGDITVLSVSGDLVTSALGWDILFDLRDLSYDIINWGEGDRFAVRLATDVVAIIPAIGMIDCLPYLKPAAKGIDAAAEVVDSVADVGKSTSKVIEGILATVENSKVLKKITDAVESAKDVVKTRQIAKKIQENVSRGYELVKTPNMELVGKVHEKSGIELALNRVIYSSGQMFQGVFPKFHAFAEVQLPKELYKSSFTDQKKYCLEKLQEMIHPVWGKYKNSFSMDQLEMIKAGIIPDEFVWHHNEAEGLMQLVDAEKHAMVSHKGGMSMWGRGYE